MAVFDCVAEAQKLDRIDKINRMRKTARRNQHW